MKLGICGVSAVVVFWSGAALAATPSVAWSKKDIQTAMRGLGYPKPHPKKLTCKTASGEAFRCVATYRHNRHRRFVTGGVALGGWLCAGKSVSSCNTLRHGFVATDQLGSTGELEGAAEFAARGYMDVRYGIAFPNRAGPCTGSGASWTCSYYLSDTETVAVTVALKKVKGGYVTSASTS